MERTQRTHRTQAGLARPTSHQASYLHPKTPKGPRTHTHTQTTEQLSTHCMLAGTPHLKNTDTQTVRMSPTDPLLIYPQSHRDSQCGRHKHRQKHIPARALSLLRHTCPSP